MNARNSITQDISITPEEIRYNSIEKLLKMTEGSNLYMTSSDKTLYILTDNKNLFIFEPSINNKTYKQLIFPSYTSKDESKLQTKEKKSQIWCDKNI